MGFCWGGARSFEYAASEAPPQAAVVFYGTSPDSATLLKVKAPVLGLYGGDDARVDATIEPARVALRKLGRSYEPNTFEGAGHGFLRAQEERDGANLRATRGAWPLALRFLRKHLGE
jgi:carboxymethylenebutenolidase